MKRAKHLECRGDTIHQRYLLLLCFYPLAVRLQWTCIVARLQAVRNKERPYIYFEYTEHAKRLYLLAPSRRGQWGGEHSGCHDACERRQLPFGLLHQLTYTR